MKKAVKSKLKKFVEVEGKTSQEAIQSALSQLKISRDKVLIKVLSEGERGLYGMSGNKPARVRVSLKE